MHPAYRGTYLSQPTTDPLKKPVLEGEAQFRRQWLNSHQSFEWQSPKGDHGTVTTAELVRFYHKNK